MYSLACADFAPPPSPEKALIMLHGYGSNGADLISLAPMLQQHFTKTLILAPHAPEHCMMSYQGRQWFSLDYYNPTQPDLQALSRSMLPAMPSLLEFITSVTSRHGMSTQDIVLLGFSQGTMMALKSAMTMPDPPAAVVGFSGALAHFTPPTTPSTAVLLVHGTHDTVVPYQASEVAHRQLNDWGIRSVLHPCEGLGHSIDDSGLQTATRFLHAYLR